jgi:hypothetical protein
MESGPEGILVTVIILAVEISRILYISFGKILIVMHARLSNQALTAYPISSVKVSVIHALEYCEHGGGYYP